LHIERRLFLEEKALNNKNDTKKIEDTVGIREKEIMVKLAVTWELCGFVEVPTLDGRIETAIRAFDETSENIPLPKDGGYVDGSFRLITKNVEHIAFLGTLEA